MIFPEERQADIRARLQRDGRVIAADLARAYETSEDTVRRDLRDLAAAGLCRRVYGGALALAPPLGSLRQRQSRNVAGKAALGRAAAGLAREGQLIFIDAGSTNLHIAQALPGDMQLTVATNAPSIAAAVEGLSGMIELIVIGGRLDRRTGGTLGAKALRDLQHLRPDLYFIGTCAIDPFSGIAVSDSEEAELKRMLGEASGSIAAAATDDKLGTGAPFAVLPWSGLDHLIVERQASLERVATDSTDGPRIITAEPTKDEA